MKIHLLFTVLLIFAIALENVRVHRLTFVERLIVFLCISGFTVQALDILGFVWTFNKLLTFQILFVGSIILSTSFSLLRGGQRKSFGSVAPQVAISLFVFSLTLCGRLLSDGQQHFAISNIRFLSAEDNAKWLNVAAELVSGDQLAIPGVGGICVVLFAIVASFYRSIAPILNLSSSEVSIVVSTVVSSYLLLIVLSPLTLVSHRREGTSLVRQLLQDIFPSLFLVAALVRLMQLGHFVSILFVLFGVTFFNCGLNLGQSRSNSIHSKIDFLIIMTAFCSLWLPFQIATFFAGLATVGVLIRYLIQLNVGQYPKILIGKVVLVFFGSVSVSVHALSYVLGDTTSDSNRVNDLFSAGGGTASYSFFERILLLFLLLLFLFFSRQNSWTIFTLNIFFIAGLSVSLLDYLVTGGLHYGSQKLEYLQISILLPCLLGPAISLAIKYFGSSMPALRTVSVVTCASFLALHSGSFGTWVDLARSTTWPSSSSDVGQDWQSTLSANEPDGQALTETPITCGIEFAPNDLLSLDYNTYLCTRILHSVAGLENRDSNSLITWQLRGDAEKSIQFLSRLPDLIKDRKILVLNPDYSVRRLETIRSYLDRM